MAVPAVGVVESVTFTVKLKEPEAVGVPEIAPAEDSVRPAGKAPELVLQLYGAAPPLAANAVEYAVPTCPDGTTVVVTCTGLPAAAIVMLSAFVTLWAVGVVESVSLAVKLNDPATVGVPEIVPVEDKLRPPGNAPALMFQLYGVVPPLPANAVEYAVPTCPEGTETVVICTGLPAAAIVRVRD